MMRFFELKVYALLHDPPDKMWTLFRGVDHVERAREIYDRVFKGTVFGGGVPPGSHPVVDRADQMAAAMDRYIHYQRQPQRDIVVYKRLHNIFAPSHSVEIEDIPTQKVEEYVSELAESINRFCKGSDEEAARRCYHVFYALYEG
ncbi:MAG: hypothetical protein QXT13_12745, partial [Pyrobaculum sp.]